VRRGRTAREIPPPLELQCLSALWTLGEVNVQAVRDFLAPRKSLAYTTVMTMLDRLTRKQVLSRRKVGRSARMRAWESVSSPMRASKLKHLRNGPRRSDPRER